MKKSFYYLELEERLKENGITLSPSPSDKRYNLDNIRDVDALINILFGERSNGKSWQVKYKIIFIEYLESVIKESIENRTRFMLVRRLADEIKSDKVLGYFRDVNISLLTKGEYSSVTIYRQGIYLANYDFETNKTIRGDKIGYIVSLTTEQNYAGVSFLDVRNIIFEEFMSRKAYLADEPEKLINLWNTVDRKRGIVKMWLLGNTISKVCPYLTDWGLQPIFRNMKQGDIVTKLLDTNSTDDDGNEIYVKCAIEFCRESGKTSFAFGKHKDMQNKGEWQSDPQPHLPKSIKEYKKLFQIGFEYKEFRFLADLLKDPDTKDIVWFIYPYNGDFKNNLYIFTDVVQLSRRYQRNIYDLSFKNEKLQNILDTFREGNIFYSDDLCGTDFKQCIDFSIRK